MISCTSVPGTVMATSTFMTSSSRGGELRSGGTRSHWLSSAEPAGVIRYAFCGAPGTFPSASCSTGVSLAVSTMPSRSSRCRVVYTWPTFSGQTSPVRASNSSRSCRPYFGPSLSRANSACRTLIASSTGYDTQYSIR